ncbi:unnamed protein product [Dicrocoelium dendriticum]|nr:unnamed protein product [Dicrocoelium dendriticum]
MTERELADDAQWKLIQKNTFTRWVNEHLKKAEMHIDDLAEDLSDGIRLVALIEVLTNQKFRQINKNPVFRTQKLDNVTKVLKYLEENEKLKLVSIDSSHIVDCNLKLILGLIWTLIMHFSISLPTWDDEKQKPQDDKGPKQRLQSWLVQKMPEPPVRNFTTDWNNGIAVGALVDACAPGLCPDWPDWDKRQALRNATEAMTAAEDWLSVPQLIRPEELINPNVDEKAVMTYISQFPNAKLKEGAPLRPRTNPSQVRAFGPGLEETGNIVGERSCFTVETFYAGRGSLDVLVINPKGTKDACDVVANNDKLLSYSCCYEPRMEGEHRIIIKFAGREIPNSPFRIFVEGAAGDPSKVVVNGPGVDKNDEHFVGRRTYFTVNARDAGNGLVQCTIVDPNSRQDVVKAHITQPSGDAVYRVEYTPKEPGVHQILVTFGGTKLPNSPYFIHVSPEFHPELAYTTGRGVQARGIRAQDKVHFNVHTEKCGGDASVQANMTRADGEAEKVSVELVEKDLWRCSYIPQRPGKYLLRVLYGGEDVQNSPFEIVVGPYKKSTIKAFGSGLTAGTVNNPNIFTVFCQEQSSKISFSIEGPSEARMDCFNNGDGTARVTYLVSQPGEYAVHIMYGGEDISDSPFMPIIYPDEGNINADRVRIHGPGVDKSRSVLFAGRPVEFYVDGLADALPSETYKALRESNLESILCIQCADYLGDPVPVSYRLRPDGSVVYSYTPKKSGVHTVSATVGNIPIKGTPFRVNFIPEIQPDRIKLWGPGLSASMQNQPTFFFANLRDISSEYEMGDSDLTELLTFQISDNLRGSIPAKVSRQPDGTFRVDYTPAAGSSAVYVSPVFGGSPTLKSPVCVPVHPSVDMQKIKVTAFDSRVFKASYVKFTVDASAIDPTGKGDVTAVVVSPNNEQMACQVKNGMDGTYVCNYTPLEEGVHHIEVYYNGIPVPGSPFSVRVSSGCDPSRVKAFGPGLEDGPHLIPGARAEFTVDLTGAGQGGLGLAVEGASEAPIECRDNRDGTCTVYYTPTEPGAYSVFVRFNDEDVPNSPFRVNVRAKIDPNRVQCYGPGLESDTLRAGYPAYFTVDTKEAGDARLQVKYTPKPGKELRPAQIQPLGSTLDKDRSQQHHYHKVTYTPEAEGICQIEVLFDGKHVPGSPFSVRIRKSCEPERVRVLGPGVEGPVLASLPATFTVDAREAGVGDLTLGLTDPKGQSVPIRVVPLFVDSESVATNGMVPSVTSLASGDVSETGLLSCTYEPYMVGPHKIHIMFAGVETEPSPFTVQSIPTGRADLCEIKDTVKEAIQVGVEHMILVDTAMGGKGRLTCQVVQPPTKPGASATFLPVETEDNKDGTTSVCYTPKQTGRISVELRYGGNLIPNGEFTQEVVTAEEMRSRFKPVAIYRPVEFRLPAPRGDAELESVVIRPSGVQQHVAHTLNDDDTITITYEPMEQGMHELHVNSFSAVKSGDVRSSTVAMPLQGSPYRFYVDSLATGYVTAYGPGLSHGVVNQPAEFTIAAKEAGGGGLSLSVEGPSKAEIRCVENSDKTCSVSYLPLAPGKYTISIKFLDQHIPGSPFVAKITGDVFNRAQLNMGSPNDITLDDFGDDIASLTATVRSPSGREDSCILKRLPKNRLGISFTPKEIGEHVISVFQRGQHIPNSPFYISISQKEIGDARKVRVFGPGLKGGRTNQPNHFTVDTRDAGYAGLGLSIEGPSKAEIECQDKQDGTCSVTYVPTEPGPYVINVKYADAHVPNSPFYVEIDGEPSTRITERITQRQEASSITTVGSRCELSLQVADTNLADLKASVVAPSGRSTPCEVIPIGSGHFSIKFVPQELGEHLVIVKHKGLDVAGSPFQFTVGPITDGMAHKVRVMGPGLQQGFTNVSNEFTIYTREAGAGTLAVAIEGPSKADIDCRERSDGSSRVSYRVSLPGVYTCSLKFNDEHIPFSPFRIDVADSDVVGRVASYTVPSYSANSPTRKYIIPHETEEFSPQANKPISFTVHHQLADGDALRAQIQAPSGAMEDATIQSKGRGQYAVRFVPKEVGPHFVHVHAVPRELVGRADLPLGPTSPYSPIQGSPFRVIINHHTADPGMVYATGDGLRRGKVGQKNVFFVNTSAAGSGVLNVTVDGPSKVLLESQEEKDGYAFSYITSVPGVYQISVKYGGDFHISGSPYKVEITGTPESVTSSRITEQRSEVEVETLTTRSSKSHDYYTSARADRVICQGTGLQHAEVQNVNCFQVDTSSAGPGVLLVGICGPTRPFEEVKVKHLGDNQYYVSYRVNQSGRHVLIVKWGDQHVPGSPFILNVP